jgi:hemolysin activation/secretion protein
VRIAEYRLLALLIVLLLLARPSFAQLSPPLPGGADVGRIEKNQQPVMAPSLLQPRASEMQVLPSPNAPEQSKKIYFQLQRVTINGTTAFSEGEMKATYAEYLDKEITLDIAWIIAGRITALYHANGFFLSRAYVPKQQIADGHLRIAVVEGYIAEAVIDASLRDRSLVQEWIQRLKAEKPTTTRNLESILLQLNDIPGVNLRATLEPVQTKNFADGAVRIILRKEDGYARGRIGFDNNGSRFLGPYQLSAQYEASFIPEQQTSFNFLTSTPARELQYGTIKQHIAAFAGGYADVYAGYTKAYPGHTIRSSDIQSHSITFGTALSYQLIRQRDENLSGKLAFETRDTSSNIFTDVVLTRDRIRALRANLNYETIDRFQGFSQLNVTLSEGLDVMQASQKGEINLSRAQATPDFTKAEFSFARSQALGENWSVVTAAAGQIASGPLYSAEEFGYGGSSIGRAYDASEITGDHGVAGSVELRYIGLGIINGVTFVPYSFYDAGAVFNDDRTQEKSQSASSAGFGVRFATESQATANLSAAFPLTRSISNPLYGEDYGPRYMFELGYGF